MLAIVINNSRQQIYLSWSDKELTKMVIQFFDRQTDGQVDPTDDNGHRYITLLMEVHKNIYSIF